MSLRKAFYAGSTGGSALSLLACSVLAGGRNVPSAFCRTTRQARPAYYLLSTSSCNVIGAGGLWHSLPHKELSIARCSLGKPNRVTVTRKTNGYPKQAWGEKGCRRRVPSGPKINPAAALKPTISLTPEPWPGSRFRAYFLPPYVCVVM